MEDCLKLKATKEVIVGILIRHKGKDFVQCLKCGSIKSDAKELAKTLYSIEEETADSDEEFLSSLGETCGDLLRKIIDIGIPERCYRDSEFCTKWSIENQERLISELNDFEDEVFIKSHDVVLSVNDVCECAILNAAQNKSKEK